MHKKPDSNFFSNLKIFFDLLIIFPRISKKWSNDKKLLPLNKSNKELYFIIHWLYWRYLRRFPNIVNPKDYNEKIQWLKLFDQSDLIIRCCDKLTLKEYVKNTVGENFYPATLKIYTDYNNINFESLPHQFVLKTTHDSGSVFLIKNKSNIDIKKIKANIKKSLNKIYGWRYGEWAYAYISPRFYVEEILNSDSDAPPPDYKFHCVNGKVEWLQYIYDRGINTTEVIVLPDGTITPIHFDHNMQHGQSFVIPPNYDQMLSLAEKLSQPFKYVRVDMYNILGKIFVGEMTFYPLMGCYKGDGQVILGKKMNFDLQTFNLPIIGNRRPLGSFFSRYFT